MPLLGKLKRNAKEVADRAGTAILTSLLDASGSDADYNFSPGILDEDGLSSDDRAPRDWTTAGTLQDHLQSNGDLDEISLSLLDRQLFRRWELLIREIGEMLAGATQPIIQRNRIPAPAADRAFFVDEIDRLSVLVHQSALIMLMEMRARVGPLAFDASDLGSNLLDHIVEEHGRDYSTLALVYSKIEQFEGFGVTTYGEKVQMQHAWYDLSGVLSLCSVRAVYWDEREPNTDAALTNYLSSVESHVQATPLVAHDYNVIGPFYNAQQYHTWRGSWFGFSACVVRASMVPQADIFAVSYKHSVYSGLFRWSEEGDFQIGDFIQERGQEGRATYIWFDQLLKTQEIDRRDWVMAGLMPYRKYSTLRVCQIGARLTGNHGQLYCCECSKSMWMDIEFAVAASTGRYFMLDGACLPNVDSNLNASVVNVTLPSYIEVTMCDVKGANDGLLMPAVILLSSAAHNYACRRVYSKPDIREAQEFACSSLLPETRGREGDYYVSANEMEVILHKALKVASVTLSSNQAGGQTIPLTSLIESFPPVHGGRITPFSFLPGLMVRIRGARFPDSVRAFGSDHTPGQYWGLHVSRFQKLAYGNLICDGDEEHVICRVVGAAEPGVHIATQCKPMLKAAGINQLIAFENRLRKSTRTW